MALGVAAMLGVALPQNFDSPYMATGPIDFWRRWHVTLSRFLRDYLYIPLGGSRGASWLRYRNLMLTMLLGGLWHGAGWTFVVWGAIHGALLCANHLYRAWRGPAPAGSRFGAGVARVFTFAAVTLAWVPFRADSLATAAQVWAAMAGAAAGTAAAFPGEAWAAVAALLALVWLAPNSQAIAAAVGSAAGEPARGPLFTWRPTPAWGFALGALALFAVADLARRSEFIYFRF
jgi:D-alanyl-lipoteichoic acid acyltransferase DltB (MBOAT superfamily)